jgi:hypothetical protein
MTSVIRTTPRPRTLVLAGFAALVVGGAVVASTGTFDSATAGNETSTVSESPAGDAFAGGAATTVTYGPDVAVDDGAQGESAAAMPPAPATLASGSADVDARNVATQAPTDQAKIVKTADLTVSIAEGKFSGAFAQASRIATANGGFVVSSSTSTTGVPSPVPLTAEDDKDGNRPRAGQLVIRVPAEHFGRTRAALAALGTLDSESINGYEVTSQLVDLDARLTTLRAEEAAFQSLLSQATEIGDILQIQDQLFMVRTQIEQLEAEQANLNDQATFSTISVSMYEPGVAFTTEPEPQPSTLSQAWDKAAGGALDVIGGMIVIIGYAIPLAAIALVAWLIWTPFRRRRRDEPTAPAAA